jgi:hypothetical protein
MILNKAVLQIKNKSSVISKSYYSTKSQFLNQKLNLHFHFSTLAIPSEYFANLGDPQMGRISPVLLTDLRDLFSLEAGTRFPFWFGDNLSPTENGEKMQ